MHEQNDSAAEEVSRRRAAWRSRNKGFELRVHAVAIAAVGFAAAVESRAIVSTLLHRWLLVVVAEVAAAWQT
jgi:hypothetical protein